MALVAVGAVVHLASAQQQADVRDVDSPYQEEFAYSIGETLNPRVAMAGIRWTSVSVAPRRDERIDPDVEIPVEVLLEFDNPTDTTHKLLVILLLENEAGAQLARIECDTVRTPQGRLKEERQKTRVDGSALLGTEKIYLFAEIVD